MFWRWCSGFRQQQVAPTLPAADRLAGYIDARPHIRQLDEKFSCNSWDAMQRFDNAAPKSAADDIVGDRAVIYAAEERHVLLTTEKIRALVDNIGGKKDRVTEGEVVKRGRRRWLIAFCMKLSACTGCGRTSTR